MAVEDYMAALKAKYPTIVIGDIEPYPVSTPSDLGDLENWLMLLNPKPAFFHLDVNFNFIDAGRLTQSQVQSDISSLQAFCTNHSIPFGVIFWPAPADGTVASSQDYYTKTIGRIQIVNGAIGLPGMSLFQSWIIDSVTGAKDLPINLPDTGNYSHTYLVHQGLAQLVTNGAEFSSQNVPNPMTHGVTYPVSVAFRNTGSLAWTEKWGYRLGSSAPRDNTTWGMRRVVLAPDETVPPGAVKTFTFNVTAPGSAGTYNFQWQMVEELVEWFGAASPVISIQVN